MIFSLILRGGGVGGEGWCAARERIPASQMRDSIHSIWNQTAILFTANVPLAGYLRLTSLEQSLLFAKWKE